MNELPLPATLKQLIATAAWPSKDGPSLNSQQLTSIVSAEKVKQFAAEESVICLYAPPFATIAQHQANGEREYWKRYFALYQITPELALVIADFGLGADAVVILDYSRNANNPPVFRLLWGQNGEGNNWVQCARDFDEFVTILGLGKALH